jgi:hypothetical protein
MEDLKIYPFLYIIEPKEHYNDEPVSKIKIIEITEKTYLVENTDKNICYRITKDNFNNAYKVLETLDKTKRYDLLLKMLNNDKPQAKR